MEEKEEDVRRGMGVGLSHVRLVEDRYAERKSI